jgi:ECF sigma factor
MPRPPSLTFPATRSSVVAAVRGGDAEARSRAYGALIEAYWRPVYTYLRLRWGVADENARDLTQEFFAVALERRYFERYDAETALFRTFLRVCLDRFVMNARKADGRLKRGGGATILPLDFEDASGALRLREVADAATPEELFRREWVRSLFGLAVDDARRALERDGKSVHFALFERYDLDADAAGSRPSYAALGAELSLSTSQVTNYLAVARRAFRRAVLERLRALSGSDAEFRASARELLGTDAV